MSKGLFAAAAIAATLLVSPGSAPAQTTATGSGLSVPVTGRVDGKVADGTFTIRRFELVDSSVHAVGTLTMSRKDRTVATVLSVPVRFGSGASGKENKASSVSVGPSLASAETPAATCNILNLTLGPLDLDLLGLRVQLDQVNLDITGETGEGKLLGNLLCAVAGLLDGGPLDQLVATLNQLLTRLLGILG